MLHFVWLHLFYILENENYRDSLPGIGASGFITEGPDWSFLGAKNVLIFIVMMLT